MDYSFYDPRSQPSSFSLYGLPTPYVQSFMYRGAFRVVCAEFNVVMTLRYHLNSGYIQHVNLASTLYIPWIKMVSECHDNIEFCTYNTERPRFTCIQPLECPLIPGVFGIWAKLSMISPFFYSLYPELRWYRSVMTTLNSAHTTRNAPRYMKLWT
jgi:hypothetical protein